METIGDAYMVAAGLLDTAEEHTEAITNMAFSMLEVAGKVLEPVNNTPLQVTCSQMHPCDIHLHYMLISFSRSVLASTQGLPLLE